MRTGSSSRFDAQRVGRLTTVNDSRRFEMEFCDSAGSRFLVSLPVSTAVEMACTICDISEHAPYLVGGVKGARERPAGR